MKKKQIVIEILIVAFIFIASLLCYIFFFTSKEPGSKILIEGDGKVLSEYSLSEDKKILVYKSNGKYMIEENFSGEAYPENHNLILIENGEVSVIHADCPARGKNRCTNQGKEKYNGNSIICQENRLVITVLGGEESDVDFVSK